MNTDIECRNLFVSDDGSVLCIGYGKRLEPVADLDPVDLVIAKYDISGDLKWMKMVDRKFNLNQGFSTEAQSVPFIEGLALSSNANQLIAIAEPSNSEKILGRWMYAFDCHDGSMKVSFAPIADGSSVPTLFCSAQFFGDDNLIGIVSATVRPSNESVKAVPVIEVYDAKTLDKLGFAFLDSVACDKAAMPGIESKGWVKACVTKHVCTFFKSNNEIAPWLAKFKNEDDGEVHSFPISPIGAKNSNAYLSDR